MIKSKVVINQSNLRICAKKALITLPFRHFKKNIENP